MNLACLAGLVALFATNSPPHFSLTDALARARPTALEADRALFLADLDAELGQTGQRLSEPAVISTELGPRNRGDGGTRLDLSLELELPLASRQSRERRHDLSEAMKEGRAPLTAAARLEAQRRVTLAYLGAWADQERVVLRRAEARSLAELVELAAEQVAAGALALYELRLVEAELALARGILATTQSELAASRARLAALVDLPAREVVLLKPELAPETAVGPSPLDEGLDAERVLKSASSSWQEARRRDLSSLVLRLGREGEEDVLLFGWRRQLLGKPARDLLARRLEAELAATERTFEIERAAIDAERARQRALLAALPVGADVAGLEQVETAMALRRAEGKATPGEALTVQRLLIAHRLNSLDNELHRLSALAELSFLTQRALR
jgi:Outer membrane efflux protein